MPFINAQGETITTGADMAEESEKIGQMTLTQAEAVIRRVRYRESGDAAKKGVQQIDGKEYMEDADGRLTPLELVKPQHKLEDEVVRREIYYAKNLSAQIGRFKGHVGEYLGDFDALLEQEYEVKRRGKKGNVTYQTLDGLMKIQVQNSDVIDFGPELQIAKQLLDECMNEWASEARPEIRMIVTRAFNTDKDGQINRSEIFMLLRLDIADPRWQRAMQAIRDAMRTVMSREYIRFYERQSVKDDWRAISIDLAKK